MNNTIVLGGEFCGDLVLDGTPQNVIAIRGGYPIYAGPTTVTPDGADHVLETAGKVVTNNITVEKIPNNYGLITWDGSVLTVS